MMSIESHGPKLSEADVSELETRLDSALPEQYRKFLLEFNGGAPTPDIVKVEGLPGGAADVQVLFGIRREVKSSCLEWNIEALAERLEKSLLPIASDSGGSVFCLSLREGDRGAVLYCDLQSVFGNLEARPALYPVSSDFEAFLNGLQPLC